jgi:hypothetical protein
MTLSGRSSVLVVDKNQNKMTTGDTRGHGGTSLILNPTGDQLLSREQAEFFAELDGLGAALRSEFVEDAAGMGLDGVFTDEELRGNFAIAHALGDEFEDIEFAAGDAEVFALAIVKDEGIGGRGWDRYFADDNFFFGFGELEAEPNAKYGEGKGGKPSVDFDGVLDDEEAIFGPLEEGDEDSADEAVDEDLASHSERVMVLRFHEREKRTGRLSQRLQRSRWRLACCHPYAWHNQDKDGKIMVGGKTI